MDEIKQYWNRALKILEEESSSPVSFETWILPIVPYKIEENSFILKIKDDFYRDMIQKRYLSLIRSAVKTATNTEYKIKLITNAELPKELPPIPQKTIIPTTDTTETTCVDNNLNPRYIFSSFVVGNSNRMAHAASLAVAEAPAEAYNPLFLYGNSGLGKTHLMHSIAHYILDKNPSTKVLYVTSETFMNEFITAIQNNKNEEFRNKYRNIDVLLIDDIQFIGGKVQTEEEFFHTFNSLVENGKQVVLTSDRPPKEIQSLTERLCSRFENGLLADIISPEYETRCAIIKRKAELLNFQIPDAVVGYIAEKIKTNIRQLEGTTKKLYAMSKIAGNPPSIALAQRVIKDVTTDTQPLPITIQRIVEEVSRTEGVSVEDLYSKKRRANIVHARKIALYMIREITNISYEMIGENFKMHHSTVIYNVEQLIDDMEKDSKLKRRVDDMISNIKDENN